MESGRLLAAWPMAALAVLLLATGCHIRGGEPSQRELSNAYRDQLERLNARGGVAINMGNAGAFQTLTFKLRLHALSKHACTGRDHVWTCTVTASVSYPPVSDIPESRPATLVMFDGPGGWRLIE